MLAPLLLLTLAITPPAAPDVLVVCPAEFRAALTPWEIYRRSQGHELAVVDVPATAVELRATIRNVAAAGKLRYVVLIGDVPIGPTPPGQRPTTIPTNYMPATVNARWGSEPLIATDTPYADLDGDQLPDVAVGRIPADSPEELAAVIRKVIRYENERDETGDTQWRRRLNVVAGVGGFGALADAVIEAAGRHVFHETVPPGYTIASTMASPTSPDCPPPGKFAAHVRQQLSDGCLAWIYLGHGRPTELDHVATPHGHEAILCVNDVSKLSCGAHSPLAVLVACYAGALDAREDCLGEELLLADQGPLAVIAATRVTMPYGNCVLGCELLRACFRDQSTALGEALQRAQRRTLGKPAADDALRTMLDSVAESVSPPPIDLAAERREHVWMYQLLGDPLVKLRLPAEELAQVDAASDVQAK